MCILCSQYDVNITRLDCSDCPYITSIPESLTKLTTLFCCECPNLTTIPESLVNLTFLQCWKCPKLNRIPKLNKLNYLYCSNCPITYLPDMPRLLYLSCSNCPLTCIPTLVRLVQLSCHSSPFLVCVPDTLINLITLYCDKCPILTDIPKHNIRTIEKSDCKWLYPNKVKLHKLVMVQRKCKKFIQKKRKVLLRTLNVYLPKDLVLYGVFEYLYSRISL